MIVREETLSYIFITQHDHAYISGEILGYLKKVFIDINQFETVKFALYQYNRGWIFLDAQPIMNDAQKKPFNFINYPEKIKLHFCKLGIEQVAQANLYAALLCSMYYCIAFENIKSYDVDDFIKKELLRQSYLMDKLKVTDLVALNYQLNLMRLCINISLYLCLNKIGCEKRREVDVFRNGFEGSEFFHEFGRSKIIASYKDKGSNWLRFNSPIFEADFKIELPFKLINKELINKVGLAEAYKNSKITMLVARLSNEPIVFT